MHAPRPLAETPMAALSRLARDLHADGPPEPRSLCVTDADGQTWHVDTVAGHDRLVIHTSLPLPAASLDSAARDCLLHLNAEIQTMGSVWLAMHRPTDTVRLFDSFGPHEATPEQLSKRVARLADMRSQIHRTMCDVSESVPNRTLHLLNT